MSKKAITIFMVALLAIVIVRAKDLYETIRFEGKGIGDVKFTAAVTRVDGKGDMFWWFYPTLAANPTSRPVLLWLHGVTKESPSFLANFGMFGPYDVNLNRRNDSWVNDYNLLFVDAPVGTGFSVRSSEDTSKLSDVDGNVEHLLRTIQSFYDLHNEYKDSPLYICSQADGSQLAIPLAIKLYEKKGVSDNFKGVILGNPVVSPASVLTKLGFYLEELAYIDGRGRAQIESYTALMKALVHFKLYKKAFSYFNSLGHFINENAGAVAVNINNIVEKLTREPNQDYFGKKSDVDINTFMQKVVAPALGIPSEIIYDGRRNDAIQAFESSFMKPIVDKVEYILKKTNLTVNIYNGNLEAVSNTPGQLEWINKLKWSGQSQFLKAPRQTLIINQYIEGYLRVSERLRFYWVNVAGEKAPLENSVAVSHILKQIAN